MRKFLPVTALVLSLVLMPALLNAAEYDITAYGAVADDGIDDLAGITDAIAAADSGDTVVLSAGTFHVSDAVVLTGGLTLAGQGAEQSIIEYLEEKSGPVVRAQNISHVTLHDLTIAGSDSSNQGIVMSNSTGNVLSDLVIRDVTIPEGFCHGIYCSTYVDSSLFKNLTITNIAVTSVWGAGIRLGSHSSYNQVLDCTMTDLGRGGILCDSGSNGNVILRNTVQRIAQAPDAPGLSIEIWGESDSCIVEDNIVDHWLSISNSSYCAIRRNTVEATDGSFQTYGLEYADGIYDVFSDNIIGEGQRLGISISGSVAKEYSLFIRNKLEYATTWGMQCQGTSHEVRYLYFYDNIFANTYKEHAEAWYNGQGHGVRFNDQCHNIMFENNHLISNGSAAIQYTGSNDSLSLYDNIIAGNDKVATGTYTGQYIEYVDNIIGGNINDWIIQKDSIEGIRPVSAWSAVLEDGAIRFTNESTDSDGEIMNAFWDLDDGIPTTEASPLHSYPGDGIYRVTLTVWDNDGLGDVASGAILIDGGTLSILAEPVITTETLPDAPEGSVSTFQMEAAASDGADGIEYELLYAPEWVQISDSGTLSFTPPDGKVGYKYYVTVRATDEAGLSDTGLYSFRIAEPVDVEEPAIDWSGLMTPYPNPFNPSVTIPFHTAIGGPVKVEIYSVTGQRVSVLLDEAMNPGDHQIIWDASGLSSGMYFCRFTQGQVVNTRKLLFLR